MASEFNPKSKIKDENSSNLTEFEARIKLTPNQYSSTLDYFKNKFSDSHEYSEYVVEYYKSDDVSVSLRKIRDQFEKKITLSSKFDNTYSVPIKYALSQEIKISQSFRTQEKPILTRKNYRDTFTFKYVNLDFTKTEEFNPKTRTNSVMYSVEVELYDKSEPIGRVYEFVEDTLIAKVLETNILYKQTEKAKVAGLYNSVMQATLLTGSDPNDFDFFSTLATARNLKIKDLTTNGIGSKYTLTIKCDGIQCVLMKCKYGMYLISTNSMNKLSNTEYNETFIIIGENISNKLFVVFDTLFYENSSKVVVIDSLTDSHSKRIETAKLFNSDNKINVIHKEFFQCGSSVKSLANAFEKAQKYKISGVETDGFIVTPEDSPFKPLGMEQPLKTRVLHLFPDICKIKFFEDLTIDVKVENGKITSRMPSSFAEENYSSKSISGYSGVVELRPTIDSKTNKIVMVFNRTREDKVYPNSIAIFEDVWKDINNPLTPDVLLGKDFSRLFHQNNKIKNLLISGISTPEQTVVLDIGSGKGGDLGKYRLAGIKHIILVEPDEVNIAELKKRITTYGMTKMVTLLECGYEDHELICSTVQNTLTPSDKFVVSTMLSMTFMWVNEYTINLFSDLLIKLSKIKNYSFIYYTAEGKTFRSYINNLNSKNNNNLEVQKFDSKGRLLPATPQMKEESIHSIFISIKNTIVRGQKEYFVFFNNLPFNVTNKNPGLVEDFLSYEEKKFGSCFVYGAIDVNFKPTKKPMALTSSVDYAQFFDYKEDSDIISFSNNKYYIKPVQNDLFHAYLTATNPMYQNAFKSSRVIFYNTIVSELFTFLEQKDETYTSEAIDRVYTTTYKRPPHELYPNNKKLASNTNFFILSKGILQEQYAKVYLEDWKNMPNSSQEKQLFMIGFASVINNVNVMINDIFNFKWNNTLFYVKIEFIKKNVFVIGRKVENTMEAENRTNNNNLITNIDTKFFA